MPKIYVQHNKFCSACHKERHKKELGYDMRDLKTYCLERHRCPNGEAIPKGIDFVPLNTDSLMAAIEENFSEEVIVSLKNMIGRTIGARISPALVMHLLKFAESERIYSINATVVHILEQHMREHDVKDDLEGSNFTHKEKKVKNVERKPDLAEEMNKFEESLRAKEASVQPEPELITYYEGPGIPPVQLTQEQINKIESAKAMKSDNIGMWGERPEDRPQNKPLTPEDLGDEKGLGEEVEEDDEEFSF